MSADQGNVFLHAADYAVVLAVVTVSLLIGIYYAVSGGRQKSTSEYLLGNRQMSVLPVALSLLVSFQSSTLMLGFPAEMYQYGTMLWLFVLSAFPANILSALFIVPLFQPLKLISVYEYLELRFKSRLVRRVGSVLGILSSIWYSGIVLYGPAIALEAVTGLPMWIFILVMAGVGIIYTSIGGYKAVIWVDVFQFLIMIVGMITIIVAGVLEVGGGSVMLETCQKGGRIDFFNPDPTVRHTFWCLIIGGTIKKLGYNVGQAAVQRMSSMESVAKAQRIVLLAIPGFIAFGTLSCLEGLIAYSYYKKQECDPFEAGLIKNSNQILPYLVMSLFRRFPGLPGLFLSSIFSASLSTFSSNLNSQTALVTADFVKPFFPQLKDTQNAVVAKLTVVVFGLLSVGIAFLAAKVKGPLYQISSLLLSSFDGPLTGLFLLGALFSRATRKGSICGTLLGFSFTLWVSMGGAFSDRIPRTPPLPSAGTEGCPNGTLWNNTITTGSTDFGSTLDTQSFPLLKLYSLSYMWLTTLGILTTCFTGLIFSYITSWNEKEDVNPAYLIPVWERLCGCFSRYRTPNSETAKEKDSLNKTDLMNIGKETVELKFITKKE